MKVILNRKLMLTTALSILVIGGMGATLVFADPTGYSVTTTTTTDRTRTVCFDGLRLVHCGPEPTTTVTVTQTVTASEPTHAPFYDVYADGQLLGVCLTWAEFSNSTTWTAAFPDANCHGVPN